VYLHNSQKLSYDDYYLNILAHRQEYLIYHDYWSNHLVLHLEQRHQVGHMNSHNQIDSSHYCHYVNSYIQMNSLQYVRIHTSYEFMLCWCNSLFVGALTFLHLWCSEGSKTVMFVSELVLMHLELRKEDLFALLLHCWQLHCLMEVAIVKVAE
jgi:hypothetical protein